MYIQLIYMRLFLILCILHTLTILSDMWIYHGFKKIEKKST